MKKRIKINREINNIGNIILRLPFIDLLFLIFRLIAFSLIIFLELNKSIFNVPSTFTIESFVLIMLFN